jgi:hypothetical protein
MVRFGAASNQRAAAMEGSYTHDINSLNQPGRAAVAADSAIENNGPLFGGLGHFRILRTSPLTPVPFVCCT